MFKIKYWSLLLVMAMAINFTAPMALTHAAGVGSLVKTLSAQTTPQDTGSGVLTQLFTLLFDKILGPIMNVFHGNSPGVRTGSLPGNPGLVPATLGDTAVPQGSATVLCNRVIAIDPGHGGNNPGVVANGDRESDNNLAISLKLKDKLEQAGAKVVLTRAADSNVASPAAPLSEELQARLDIANAHNATIFISIHSNENQDKNIKGAETFFAAGKSSRLAHSLQDSLILETHETDKGVAPEDFYVLRNNSVPSALMEVGFVSNSQEAGLLKSDSYRDKIATGIFNGIVKYFNTTDK